MEKFVPYFWKIIWVIGLIIFVNFSLDFENQMKQTASTEFNVIPVLWFDVIHPILFGFYLSFIFVKKWSVKMNASLFWCVAIPCLVLLCGYPLLATLSNLDFIPDKMHSLPISTWAFKAFMSYSYVFGIIAGLTLILSFFSTHPTKSKKMNSR
ncbi:hypothetical protein CSE16_00590 [Solibacillus sp. R5-41]|uniref:hypothetical protein n=1 Tax=Solibacillus sp. R5-41 TaxID=2048654 RepID=UPI000C1284FC|nr:hypothetical protein [Solibacillus sp. R5-41]ATP38648.1 hypothetical protein CSE16_00590 [Solibacillus sp. R5-41]